MLSPEAEEIEKQRDIPLSWLPVVVSHILVSGSSRIYLYARSAGGASACANLACGDVITLLTSVVIRFLKDKEKRCLHCKQDLIPRLSGYFNCQSDSTVPFN